MSFHTHNKIIKFAIKLKKQIYHKIQNALYSNHEHDSQPFTTKHPDIFKDKSLPQILSFAGDGKLKDGNTTSSEFRNLLDIVQPNILFEFANYCLSNPFENSGLALQDIVNQIGKRLNFDVEYGLYKGKKNSIGFDGIWTTKDGYNIIIEVKTTDYIRINLSESVANIEVHLSTRGK